MLSKKMIFFINISFLRQLHGRMFIKESVELLPSISEEVLAKPKEKIN